MTPSNCVLLSWNLTILFLLSLPTLWKFFSWGGVVGGLSIVLIVAVIVAANGDLAGDNWSGSEPRTLKMFLGDVMYVVFGPLLFVLPALLFIAILSPIFALVALWKSLYLEAFFIVLISIFILVGFEAFLRAGNKPMTDKKSLRRINKAAVKKKRKL